MARTIIYLGLEKCDIVYHLGMSLGAKYKVLICDNSLSGDLFSSINKSADAFCSLAGVDYVKEVSPIGIDEYDYVLVYAGERMEKEYLSYSGALFLLMPQCSWQGLSAIRDLHFPYNDLKHILIIREYFTSGITSKSISVLLDTPPDMIDGRIAVSAEDQEAYLSLSHNGQLSPRRLSQDAREALIYILSTLEGIDRRSALLMLSRSWKKLKRRKKQEERQKRASAKKSREEKTNGHHNQKYGRH